MFNVLMRSFFPIGTAFTMKSIYTQQASEFENYLTGPIWNAVDFTAIVEALNNIINAYKDPNTPRRFEAIATNVGVVAACLFMAVATVVSQLDKLDEFKAFLQNLSFAFAMLAAAIDPVVKILHGEGFMLLRPSVKIVFIKLRSGLLQR